MAQTHRQDRDSGELQQVKHLDKAEETRAEWQRQEHVIQNTQTIDELREAEINLKYVKAVFDREWKTDEQKYGKQRVGYLWTRPRSHIADAFTNKNPNDEEPTDAPVPEYNDEGGTSP